MRLSAALALTLCFVLVVPSVALVAQETDCTDGIDNDGDGGVDCQDPDGDCPCDDGTRCNRNGVCVETNCSDGIDNDGDNRVDCDDGSCNTRPCDDGFACTSDETCISNVPLDERRCEAGSVDHRVCDDGVFCNGEERCNPEAGDADPDTGCRDTLDPCIDPGEGCNELERRCVELACTDRQDNDSQGGTDCVDDLDCPCPDGSVCETSTFPPHCVETACNDGLDNDRDGLEDCTDGDCACGDGAFCDDRMFPPMCREKACDDGADNDGDGEADCNDPDDCPCPAGTVCNRNGDCVEDACGDGIDNDGNGRTDCEEGRCNGRPCDDGIACTSDETCVSNVPLDERRCEAGTFNNNVCNDGQFCDGSDRCSPQAPDADPVTGCRDKDPPCADPDLGCDEDEDRCIELDCANGEDDDGDGAGDCADPDCAGEPCDDALACTTGDTCLGGRCAGRVDDSLCDDGLHCNGAETCHPERGCIEPAMVPCDDDGEKCFEAEDRCFETSCGDGLDNDGDGAGDCGDPDCAGEPCDDGNDCTRGDLCSGSVCEGRPADPDCDDGLFCNGVETCDASGGCLPGEPPCAPDETCDEDADACLSPEICDNGIDDDGDGRIDCADPECEEQPCDPGAECLGEAVCMQGDCIGVPDDALCDDDDPCTAEVCDPASGRCERTCEQLTAIDALEAKADAAEVKLDGLGAAVGTLEAKADAQEGKLDMIEAKADALEAKADTAEAARENIDRLLVEHLLHDKDCVPALWLPVSHGGRLEDVQELVARRIAQAEASGDPRPNLPVARARLAEATENIAAGRYQDACKRLSDSLRALTTP